MAQSRAGSTVFRLAANKAASLSILAAEGGELWWTKDAKPGCAHEGGVSACLKSKISGSGTGVSFASFSS
jgi:hypothetical protein